MERLDDDLRPLLRGRAGTFFPFLRASDRPMAIACAREVTAPPCPFFPRLSEPRFSRRSARSTSFDADGLYFRVEDFLVAFFLVDFFLVAMRHPRCA